MQSMQSGINDETRETCTPKCFLMFPYSENKNDKICLNGVGKANGEGLWWRPYTVCVEDQGLHSQKYWYVIFFACFIGKLDSSHVEIYKNTAWAA